MLYKSLPPLEYLSQHSSLKWLRPIWKSLSGEFFSLWVQFTAIRHSSAHQNFTLHMTSKAPLRNLLSCISLWLSAPLTFWTKPTSFLQKKSHQLKPMLQSKPWWFPHPQPKLSDHSLMESSQMAVKLLQWLVLIKREIERFLPEACTSYNNKLPNSEQVPQQSWSCIENLQSHVLTRKCQDSR